MLRLDKRTHSPACLKFLAMKGTITSKQELEKYRHCRCAWWVTGVTDYGKNIERHSLKVYTWEATNAAVKTLNQADAADGRPTR
jgi:hypothetical protein